MNESRKLSALVVHESWFGNTEAIARAVAEGLALEGFDVHHVPITHAPRGPVEVDLLVVGAPTHAFGLSKSSTRKEAIHRGAADVGSAFGMREWLDQLPEASGSDRWAAAFDTRADKARRLPFAAGPAAQRRLHRHGYQMIGVAGAFLVEDTAGPLLPGELEHAARWGRELAAIVWNRQAAIVAGGAHRTREGEAPSATASA